MITQITIILLILTVIIAVLIKNKNKFKYHAQNPYIRECIKCGAVQNQFHMRHDSSESWWQEVHKGNDEKM